MVVATPPAEIRPLNPLTVQEIQRMNGVPVWSKYTHNTRLVAICWEDGAAPSGMVEVPTGLNSYCFRPDLRSEDGQRWQKRFNVTSFPNSVNLPGEYIARLR